MPLTDLRVSKTLMQFVFTTASFSKLDVATKAATLALPLFKRAFDFSYRHLQGVKGKLAVKSPSKKCPGATELQS